MFGSNIVVQKAMSKGTPQPALPSKRSVLGVGISATSYEQVLLLCRRWVDRKRGLNGGPGGLRSQAPGRAVFVCTVHSVMTGVFEPEFKDLLNSADLATPDGMPLAWALRSFGVREQGRVYGPDLMLEICRQAQRLGHRIFLYGGREQTMPRLLEHLKRMFPQLTIAGTYCPPFRPLRQDEDQATVELIQNSAADIVFVGIGAPRQERWIAEHRNRLPGVVMVGVGAAFDFHAGERRQAPRWMQQAGLEWFFRLLIEPRRLWKRYVVLNPLFLLMWGLQLMGWFDDDSPRVNVQGQDPAAGTGRGQVA